MKKIIKRIKKELPGAANHQPVLDAFNFLFNMVEGLEPLFSEESFLDFIFINGIDFSDAFLKLPQNWKENLHPFLDWFGELFEKFQLKDVYHVYSSNSVLSEFFLYFPSEIYTIKMKSEYDHEGYRRDLWYFDGGPLEIISDQADEDLSFEKQPEFQDLGGMFQPSLDQLVIKTNRIYLEAYITFHLDKKRSLKLHRNPINIVKSLFYIIQVLKAIEIGEFNPPEVFWVGVNQEENLKRFLAVVWEFYNNIKEHLTLLNDPLIGKIISLIEDDQEFFKRFLFDPIDEILEEYT